MDLASAIERRRSVRRYEDKPVPKTVVQQVLAVGREADRLYPDIDVRWYTVWDGDVITRQLEGRVGIYGMYSTTPHYLLAVSQEQPGYMENLGFCMEQMVLAATDLGLGTCWIGGMFTEEGLRPYVPDLGSDERIVALCALGYPDTSQGAHIAQQLLNWGNNRLVRRKPLTESVSQYIWTVPWAGEDSTLNEILELTQLAPSWGNIQPWHLVVDDRWVIATADHRPQQGNDREGKAYYRLDAGIAMCHFWLAARARGWSGSWRIPEDAGSKMLRDRYAIPTTHDLLGFFPLE